MKIYIVGENAFQTPLYDVRLYTSAAEALNTAIAVSNYKQCNCVVIAFEKEEGNPQMQYCGIENICHNGKIIR